MENNSTIGQDLRVIQEKGIGPLMRLMTNAAQSGNQVEMTPLQKRLYERKYGSAPKPETIVPIKSQKPDKTQKPTSGGSITRVGGKTYRMDNPADVKALNAVLAADKASRPGQQFADLRGGGGMTTQTPPVGPVGPPSPSADPRNAEYLTARDKLTEDSTAEDIKKVEDIGMTAWAKANPKLAAKVKPGQSGYGVIQGLGKEKDQSELLSDYKVMAGENYNEDEGKAIAGGGSVEVDIDGSGPETVRIAPKAQAFKDDAMAALLGNYGNINYKPIVEGITLPTTTDYAGAFNQTDVPDLQSMMNMGEQLGNLGYEGPSFSQSFKDRFQNIMLGK